MEVIFEPPPPAVCRRFPEYSPILSHFYAVCQEASSVRVNRLGSRAVVPSAGENRGIGGCQDWSGDLSHFEHWKKHQDDLQRFTPDH
jgi:hypothetical protein